MLEQVAHFNDLSPKLREKLEKRLESFGKTATYKFNIERPDPHPDNRGKVIFPQMFALGPVQFKIVDKEEDRQGKSKQKQIALIKGVDEKGLPNAFDKIRVHEFQRGLLRFELDRPEEATMCALIELHPKLNGGMFQNTNILPVVSRTDDLAEAKKNRVTRKSKATAMSAAEQFKESEVRDFVCAMNWDETELMDILRDKVETHAEKFPDEFLKIVDAPEYNYRTIVKRAVDRQAIIYIPLENKFVWGSNNQTIVVLERQEGDTKDEVQRMAEYLLYNGKNGEAIYNKLKALLK